MSGGTLIFLELLLVLGLVLGFGVWQLMSLRRDDRQARKPDPPSPPDPGPGPS